MKKLLFLLPALALITACNSPAEKQAQSPAIDANVLFDRYKDNFIEALWKQSPGWASSQGYHKYDSILIVPDENAVKEEALFCQAQLDSLKKFKPEALNANNRTDYYLIDNHLKGVLWSRNAYRSFEWNPSEYNVISGIAELLNGNYDKLDIRLRNIYLRMKKVPAYYEAAFKNIKNPTTEHTKLGIEQNLNSLPLLEKDLSDSVKVSGLTEQEKKDFELRITEAVSAVKNYTTLLKSLKTEHPRSFRLGKELHAQKFVYDIQSRYTADEIYAKALARKAELHREMYKISVGLWDKCMKGKNKPQDSLLLIRQVIDALSVNHVSKDSFQVSIEKQLPVLTDFITKKNLITLDPSKPLVVRKEPAYMAGVAGASISSPGPYEKNGKTYYNVGSLAGWDNKKAESYLREYNDYILQILNIHEALPGHYAQLIYSNQSPSLIKAILGNGAMVEGWAVYTERMMMENGYGNNAPEMWLMYYKWHLRAVCNTILDYSVHALGMEKEAALNLLQREAFQQEAEAEGKWNRVSLTQVQLCCYFTGYAEIYDLREELKQKMGDKFDLKAFHEKFLSYGSAPVKYIRELMM